MSGKNNKKFKNESNNHEMPERAAPWTKDLLVEHSSVPVAQGLPNLSSSVHNQGAYLKPRCSALKCLAALGLLFKGRG